MSTKKTKGYWSKEKCIEEALKYTTRTELKKYSGGAYNSCQKNNWINDVCSHMNEIIKTKGYWTKEKCQAEALKYETKKDFRINSSSVYSISIKKEWIVEICSHMKSTINDSERCIYVYEFSDNHVYVGLTNNLKRRKREHKKEGSVYNYLQTNKNHELKQLTEYIDVNLAKEKEEYYVNEYKSKGWKILNITKTGSLGSNIRKWTKEKCHEESLKYKYRKDFQLNNIGAYQSAQKNKWLDEICSHMKRKKYSHKIYWTKERCQTEALNYKTRNELKIKSIVVYKKALKNKWLDEICFHMNEIKKPSGYWTKEKCQEEALKYKTKSDFKKKSRGAYNSSYNKWLDEICSHMNEVKKHKGYWTKEKCQEEALKYKTRSDFYINSPGVHSKALKNKWLDEICSHMISKKNMNKKKYNTDYEKYRIR